jgi:hypothetical protein
MSDLAQNVLGGFLAAVAFSLATAAWKFIRRPVYIPFDDSNWSNAQHVALREAGYDPAIGKRGWVINYEVRDYLAQGRTIVRFGRWPRKREVRATQKVGYAVLMK